MSREWYPQYQGTSSGHSLPFDHDIAPRHQRRPHVVHHQRSGELGVIATAVPVRQRPRDGEQWGTALSSCVSFQRGGWHLLVYEEVAVQECFTKSVWKCSSMSLTLTLHDEASKPAKWAEQLKSMKQLKCAAVYRIWSITGQWTDLVSV